MLRAPDLNSGAGVFFTIFIITFALRAKIAHLKSLCCLQCILQVTIEQNIHKGIEAGAGVVSRISAGPCSAARRES